MDDQFTLAKGGHGYWFFQGWTSAKLHKESLGAGT